MSDKKYYKILVNGESCHGGTFKWSLPEDDKPGEWHVLSGEVRLCETGFHLTNKPIVWWKHNAECFEAEIGDVVVDNGGDKIATNKVRLLRRLNDEELIQFGIYRAGKHEIKEGTALVAGSAQVTAYHRAQVTASGSAQVTANNKSTVLVPETWNPNPTVTLDEAAVMIDQRTSPPTVSSKTDLIIEKVK